MKCCVIVAAALCLAAPVQGTEPAVPGAARKTVLVTGASTGIGHKIAERLTANGYFVYAGARKDKDLEAPGKLQNVPPLRLDVTSAADIAAAVDTTRSRKADAAFTASSTTPALHRSGRSSIPVAVQGA